MRRAQGVLALLLAVAASAGFWWMQGRAQELPGALAAGQRLECVSYTPFRDGETPMAFRVEPARLEQDLALIATLADCVRIYSVRGMELVPEVARRHGLEVIAGAWVGRDDADTEREIAGLIALANRHPEVVRAVLVGNEVLLRRERTAAQMLAYTARVRAAVAQPVSYGDVWEFWLQNPELAAGVDFLTIHLLPYWENDPSGIADAIAAVARAHESTARAFPGKEILIGETGWPSEGRQREAALPGRVNEARFVRGFVELAQRNGWRYNLIEAFDQPWKRWQEGIVGGYWGLFTADRIDKGLLRGAVSNLPGWPNWLALALGLFALLAVGCGLRSPASLLLAAVAANGAALQVCQMLLYSRSPGESAWFLGLAALALLLSWRGCRRLRGGPASTHDDVLLVVVAALAAVEMLGLAFDPRYRHFPVAVFAAPALVAWNCSLQRPEWRERGRALGLLLVLCIPAVLWQESLRNAQALGWVAVTGLMALGLWRGGVQAARVDGR